MPGMTNVRASHPFTYNGQQYATGDVVSMTDRDARLYVSAGMATYEGAAPPSQSPTFSEQLLLDHDADPTAHEPMRTALQATIEGDVLAEVDTRIDTSQTEFRDTVVQPAITQAATDAVTAHDAAAAVHAAFQAALLTEVDTRIAEAGTGAGLDAEAVRDTVAAFLVAGANVLIAHDDTANTLTVEATGGGGGGTTSDTVDGGGATSPGVGAVDGGGSTSGSVAPSAPHSHPASEITGATSLGLSLLQAASMAAARTAIGAGTSNLTLGTSSSTAKAGDYAPTVGQITDATFTGRSVLLAADAASARSVIEAGTSNLAIGSTASTAKAGNWVPALAEVTGLQAALDLKAAITNVWLRTQTAPVVVVAPGANPPAGTPSGALIVEATL